MDVETEYDQYLEAMPKDFEEFIVRFLGMVPENEVAHLSLTGFHKRTKDAFPKNWKIDVHEWDSKEKKTKYMWLGNIE